MDKCTIVSSGQSLDIFPDLFKEIASVYNLITLFDSFHGVDVNGGGNQGAVLDGKMSADGGGT